MLILTAMGDYDTESPEFSGWALFLVSISQSFNRCKQARVNMDIQDLINNLDSLSLEFKGYYEKTKDDKKKDTEVKQENITNRIFAARKEINGIIEKYLESDSYEIPAKLWKELYDIENALRYVWFKSGLQMSMRPKDEDDDY